ncbi:TSC2 [Acanthosepion pharaonis]|uniref:TSC2 n=1 Tax=Acanthosepion pharaonis TaxID=158019 RepID=A0A812ASY1_ACAPH|nr:TSC2 [Sepia pharaonis]
MSRQGKSEEKFTDIIKNFFGLRSSSTVTPPRSLVKEVVFTPNILQDIGPSSPPNKRIDLIKNLSDAVVRKTLEENAVAAIWEAIRDLVDSPSTEDRHVTLVFLLHIIKGQGEHLGPLRSHFFRVIQNLSNPEDLSHRLELFHALTANGKDLTYFETETGTLILNWMFEISKSNRITEFLALVVNIIRYNVGYFDDSSMSGIIKCTCTLTATVKDLNDIQQCVELLGLVIHLQCVPSECLTYIVTVLCRTLNIRNNGNASREVMRKLLSTHLGHHVVHLMCCMLEEKDHPIDEQVLRAAVYYLGMALWGSKKVTTLSQPPSAVLPSFLQVLERGSQLVAFEITLSVGQLVKKYGQVLTYAGWDMVMDILSLLLKNPEWSPPNQVSMEEHLHSTLTDIETLHQHGLFSGSTTKLFLIIESCAVKRPAASVVSLISYRAESLNPEEDNWVNNLHQLLERYFRQEIRTEIRIKALDVLSMILSVNRNLFEEQLVETVVISFLKHLENDPDPAVRKAGAELLLTIIPHSRHYKYLLDVVERVVTKPVQLWLQSIEGQNVKQHLNDPLVGDTRELVKVLVETFKTKIYSPPGNCSLCIYNLLVKYARFQYSHPLLITTGGEIRWKIIECLLLLRSNNKYQVGVATDLNPRKIPYSPYLFCKISPPDQCSRTPPGTPTSQSPALSTQNSIAIIDFSQALLLFNDCLQHEKDWSVWKCFLNLFPKLLRNKTLVLSERGQLMDLLCRSLCNLITNRNLGLPRKLLNRPSTFTPSDFHMEVFPVLSAIVTYQSDLQRSQQMELINCFQFGLVSKCPQLCMNALRMCALEMPDAMTRFLPEIILSLSKISSTVYVGIPVLSFLSTIVRFPKLYVSFTSDQYLSIFAIALPYTNPFKFSHYMVSLAYHVIAAWFTHCRVEWRWHFVKYVQKSLSRYVQQEFEENAKQRLKSHDTSPSPGSSSSATRARAGSCDGADKGRRRFKSGSSLQESPAKLPINEKAYQFHMELTETCIDMMSRYTHANFAAVPKRSPLMEFLLSGGRTKSWLVGHKIISITTSGGGKKIGLQGICEKCLMLYQQAKEDNAIKRMREKKSKDRKRHKSAALFTRSVSHIDEPTLRAMQTTGGSEDGSKKRAIDDMGLLDAEPPVFSDDINPISKTQIKELLQNSSQTHQGTKNSDSIGTMFLPNLCTCWCVSWAEIRIRSPSGSISWMMRIENHLNPYGGPSDLPLADISVLQIPVKQHGPCLSVDGFNYRSNLSEDEYETLYKQRFPTEQELAARRFNDYYSKDGKQHLSFSSSIFSFFFSLHLFLLFFFLFFPSFFLSFFFIYFFFFLSPFGKTLLYFSFLYHLFSPLLSLPKLYYFPLPLYRLFFPYPFIVSFSPTRLSSLFPLPVYRLFFPYPFIVSFSPTRLSSLFPLPVYRIFFPYPFIVSFSPTRLSSLFPLPVYRLFFPYPFIVSLYTSTSSPETESLSIFRDCIDQDGGVQLEQKGRVLKKSTSSPSLLSDESSQRWQYYQQQKTPPYQQHHFHYPSRQQTPPFPGDDDAMPRPRLLSMKVNPTNASDDFDEQSSMESVIPHRPRGQTISIPSPHHTFNKLKKAQEQASAEKPKEEEVKGGIDPSFVFLQLYGGLLSLTPPDIPLLLPHNQETQRSLELLDYIPSYETHKIGVLYVGENQCNSEVEILSNQHGSERYQKFLENLGQLIYLKDTDGKCVFLGGLDGREKCDGQFAYSWHDEFMQVIFHVATLMPNMKNDKLRNNKKRHIGNDYVNIVYNDSGEEYQITTLRSELNFVNIIIEPLDCETNAVTIVTKESKKADAKEVITADIAEALGQEAKIISDKKVASLVRLMAIHCNLAAMVLWRQQNIPEDPFASNWLERLRHMKRLHNRVMEELKTMADEKAGYDRTEGKVFHEDFTDYS